MRFRMLAIWLLIAAVILVPVLCAFAGDDPPGNVIEHVQEDAPRDDDEPDLMAAAA
ncbi:MAG TPA: hypothetical protein VGS62_11490 [Streptosporangiaceae bacterium]|nr:hypothetical protein [Streptosporangiaceae bacterium]